MFPHKPAYIMQDTVCTHAHKTDCAGVDVEFSSDNRVDV